MVSNEQEALKHLIAKLCEINSIVNQTGKGWDDLPKEIYLWAIQI